LLDLTLRICGVALRLSSDDADLMRAARRRYAPFRGGGAPAFGILLEGRGGLLRVDSALRIALSYALLRRGGFLCHAAAVDGRLFPGLSGAGKSTLGRSTPPRRLLADELVGVSPGRLHGTPFRGNFQRGRNNISRPLEAIVFLDRSALRGVWPLPKAEALARLLGCVLYFGDDAASGRKILRVARACVERVPTFALSYDAQKTGFRRLERILREALLNGSRAAGDP
jgi:hypothetical protein